MDGGGNLQQDNKKKENNMRYWLQSLSENGFDVFIVVYLAILFLVYHYLMRWYLNKKFERIEAIVTDLYDHLDE